MDEVHQLKESLVGWLADQPLGLAATLTFTPRAPAEPGIRTRWLDVPIARETTRVYLRKLNRLAYGSSGERKGRRLAAAVVREGGSGWDSKHLHYHLALQVPDQYSPEDWARRARTTWTEMAWASPANNVFKPMWSRQWIDYILKDRDKPLYLDAMDFESWHLV